MAEKKKEEVTEVTEPVDQKKYWDEKVPFYAFKDTGRYKDDLFVAHNGKTYLIQRGQEVMIPRKVRQILYDSMAQDQRTAELIERESAKFERESAKYK